VILVDVGYLSYHVTQSPEYYYEPWKLSDDMCEKGYILCMDSEQSIRRDKYPWYKSNRSSPLDMPMRNEAHEWRREAVKRYGPSCCRAEAGLEADDLLGLYASPGDILITEDKDLLQLLGVNFVNLYGKEWGIDRLRKYCKQPGFEQGEAFLAWQLCVGDGTDTIPRLLDTKDRTTIPSILKTVHPLRTVLDMVNLERAINHLNCLLVPTPLFTGEDTIKYVKERYGF
jgi:hypothetical protein